MAESAPLPPAPEDPAANRTSSPPANAAGPVKRKRRRWPFVLLGLLVLLIVLVLLAPTIASTSLVRGYVIGKINDNLNGTVSIDNWSLGWTGGMDVHGLKLFDDRKAEVLS